MDFLHPKHPEWFPFKDESEFAGRQDAHVHPKQREGHVRGHRGVARMLLPGEWANSVSARAAAAAGRGQGSVHSMHGGVRPSTCMQASGGRNRGAF